MRSPPSIAGAAIAALGLTPRPVRMSCRRSRPNGVLPVVPDASVASSAGCERRVMPAPLRDGQTDLVIATPLAGSAHVAVWQDRNDGHAYDQCLVSDGSPRGTRFRIDAQVESGILPVIVAHSDGSFAARWIRDGKKYEQRFDAQGVPRVDKAQTE